MEDNKYFWFTLREIDEDDKKDYVRVKGNSLIEKPVNYTIIDLETTGLDSFYDDIIELAAIKVRDNVIVDKFQKLVKPDFPVCKFIEELTGITNEMLLNEKRIENTLPSFLDFIGDDIVIGHNVNFDINFICDSLHKIKKGPFKNDFIDTMRLSRRLHPEIRHHRLCDLVERYNIEVNNAHRALFDCETTYQVYNHIWEEVNAANIDISLTRSSYQQIRANNIVASGEPDPLNPFYEKTVVFTGALSRCLRAEAMQLVANIGGINGDSVTKKTDYLVLGNVDYKDAKANKKSSKYLKAEQLILKGQELEIISENVFFEMLSQEK